MSNINWSLKTDDEEVGAALTAREFFILNEAFQRTVHTDLYKVEVYKTDTDVVTVVSSSRDLQVLHKKMAWLMKNLVNPPRNPTTIWGND